MEKRSLTLHLSKILITNDGEPIINGALLIEDSKIVQIGKKEDFGNINIEIIDHGDSLICPGFINLHTHLAYSNITLNQNYENLFSWLEDLVDKISNWTEKDYIESINYGINQLLLSGTTYVVENTLNPLSATLLSKSPLRALIGLEVFGSDEERADEIFFCILQTLSTLESKIKTQNLGFTLSPHAPYDVSVPLWKKLIDWSIENNKPLLTHIDESPDERLWWQKKSGKCVDFWKKINKLDPKLKYWKKYKSSVDFLYKNNLLNKNIIATHLCQATQEDLLRLKERGLKIVHCPRSNFYLNNGTANLKLWGELGFIWGVGTDSIASNKNLDLLEELRFTINQQDLVYNFKISARDAFCAITLNAAKILNKGHEIGVLKKGYSADFLIYDIKEKSGCTYKDPYHLIVWDIDNKKHLKEVWINGDRAWLSNKKLLKAGLTQKSEQWWVSP